MKGKHENTVDMPLAEKYRKAKSRVEAMQGFYYHLCVYILINGILLLFRPLFNTWAGSQPWAADELLHWADLNIILTPVLWGLVLFIHYLVVFGFKPAFLKRWEERQIARLLGK